MGQLPRPADHRHRSTTSRLEQDLAGSPSATTPGACTSTSASAAPIARSPSATGCASCCRRCSPLSGELALPRRPRHRPALGPQRDLHPHLPALRRPRALWRLGALRGLRRPPARERDSIVESTQLWWSVRPHHSFGTVEVRICDAQSRGDESLELAALIAACVAQAAIDHDERGYAGPSRWRQRDRGEPVAGDPLRHGRRADRLPRRREVESDASGARGSLEWTEPGAAGARDRGGDAGATTAPSGRARRSPEGAPIEEIYREPSRRPRTYAPEGAVSGDEAQQSDDEGGAAWPKPRSRPESGRARVAQRGGAARASSRRRSARSAVEDVLLQSVVSILNLTARRIAKEDERDLEQAQVGIDAVRALIDLLEPEEPGRSFATRSPSCRCCTRSTPGVRRPARRGIGGRRGGAAPERGPSGRAGGRRGARASGRRPGSVDIAPPQTALLQAAVEHANAEGDHLTDFLTDYGVVVALVCAAAAWSTAR